MGGCLGWEGCLCGRGERGQALEAEISGALVIVGKSLYRSEPQFIHLFNRCDNAALIGVS